MYISDDMAVGQNDYFNYDGYGGMGTNQTNVYDAMLDNGNVINRWWQPGKAEAAQFERENYFVDKENRFNEYMWNKANEYNSPTAQMQRMKEAGINGVLAAGAIGGNGAGQTIPMQGGKGDTGMNTNASSPFSEFGNAMNAIKSGVEGTEGLGRLFGFGKENKASIDKMRAEISNIWKDTGIKGQELKRLEETFDNFITMNSYEVDIMWQNYQNLIATYDNINADTAYKEAQTDLTDEQINTQTYITDEAEYKAKEAKFKDLIRETFGVNINESDTAMLAQLILSGKGDAVIKAIGDTLSSIVRGIKEETKPYRPWGEDKTEDSDYATFLDWIKGENRGNKKRNNADEIKRKRERNYKKANAQIASNMKRWQKDNPNGTNKEREEYYRTMVKGVRDYYNLDKWDTYYKKWDEEGYY